MPASAFKFPPSRLRFAACSSCVTPSAADEGQRFLRIHVQAHAAVFGAEIGRAVRERAAAAIARRHAEHDISADFIDLAEAVTHPRANGRMLQLARMPPRLPGQLRAMIVVNRPERAHHREELVRAFAHILERVADDQSARALP